MHLFIDLGMKLCTCFQRTRASYPRFLVCTFTERSFYLDSTFITGLILNQLTTPIKLHILGRVTRFVCATYSTLYLKSSQSYVTLCDLLFILVFLQLAVGLVKTERIKKMEHRWFYNSQATPFGKVNYLLQSYKIFIFANALLCTLLCTVSIHQGLNVTYLIHLIQVRNILSESGFLVQINAIHAKKTKISASCLTSLSLYRLARILDLAYITFKSSSGSIGLKVVSIF